MKHLASISAFLMTAACGAATGRDTTIALDKPPTTSAIPAAASCPADAGDQQPDVPAGKKRFQVKLSKTPDAAAWVTFGDAGPIVLGDDDPAEACFLVDLPAGMHDLTMRGHGGAEGVGLAVKVSEYGPAGGWWYDTFAMHCGVPGPCEREQLADWKTEVEQLKKNLRDPCGSTKIHHAEWTVGRTETPTHPADVGARAVLKVYDFATDTAPGQCKAAGGPGPTVPAPTDDAVDTTPPAE